MSDVEVLGYNFNPRKLASFIESRAKARENALRTYLKNYNDFVNSNDFAKENQNKTHPILDPKEITMDDLMKWRAEKGILGFLSRIDLVGFLIDNRINVTKPEDRRKVGDVIKDQYSFLFSGTPPKPTFKEVIEAITATGGHAVVAHPAISKAFAGGMQKEWQKPEKEWFSEREGFTLFHFLHQLKGYGVKGAEQYYYAGSDRSHAEEQDKINYYFRKLAEKLDLHLAYGPDCHGEDKKKGKMPLMANLAPQTWRESGGWLKKAT